MKSSRHRSSHLTSATSKLRREMLVLERLESRQLLAIDMLAMVCQAEGPEVAAFESESAKADKISHNERIEDIKPTHTYTVTGEQVDMHIHPTRVALSVAPGVDGGRELLATSGFEYVRAIDESFAVYQTVGDAAHEVATLKNMGIVDAFVPVFVLHSSNSEAVVLNELLVSLEPGTDAAEFFDNHRATFSAYRRLDGTPNQFVATIAAGRGEVAIEALSKLQVTDLEGVQWIEPNFYHDWQKYYIPNDERFGNLWHLHNTGQSGQLVDADSDLPEAWDLNPGGSASYVIGIVDDAVANHPDLKLWVNTGETPGNGIDDDGNGWIDDIHGWNFVTNNNQTFPTTASDNHGTPVAGVAAARGDNGIGVAGASYNAFVSVSRIVEGSAWATSAGIASALYYQAGRKADASGTWKSADLINNSWGGGGFSAAINDALTWGTTQGRMGAGAPIFFASGNGGVSEVGVPMNQALVTPGMFVIGATNSQGMRSHYSVHGEALDFVTPSDGSWPGHLTIDTTDVPGAAGNAAGDYTGADSTGFGGTSSASPLATGIAALVMDQADRLGVTLSPAQLRQYLRQTTDIVGGVTYDTTTGRNLEMGFGRLNAFTAVDGIGKAEISVMSSTADLVSGVSTVDVGVGDVGDAKDVVLRVRNQGTSTLNLTGLTITGDSFTTAGTFSSSSLGMGESATFVVSFQPTSFGPKAGMVSITSSDADEGTFTFDLTGTAIVKSISGHVVEDWNGNGTADSVDTPLGGRLVYIDENNNGTRDVSDIVFTQSSPTTLPDVSTVTSSLVVSGVISPILDVNVRLNITHTWVSDLVVTLVSPSGQRVLLFSGVGGSGRNFVNTVLDDEATAAITSGTAPFTGSFRPAQPLSALVGTNANGTWQLEVRDAGVNDVGTLNNWSLTFLDGEQATTTDASGNYFFESLPIGTYDVRTVDAAGWSATGATVYTVTLTSPNDFFANRDFGFARSNRFYGLVFGDDDGNGTWGATEIGLADRTVFFDMNDNGVLDGTTATFTNSTRLAIPDASRVFSDLEVSDVNFDIRKLTVKVNFGHSRNADLDVFLVHPDGTRVELFTDVGGSTQNFINTILDDDAPVSIVNGTAPFTGTFRPEGPLSALAGKPSNGMWRLEVTDDSAIGIGTLSSWELTIEAGAEVSRTTDSLGRVGFDLSAGAHKVQLLGADGWFHTVPTDGSRTVTTSGFPFVNQTFGSRTLPPDTTPPTLSAAWIAGTAWNANFPSLPLTVGMMTLPYVNLNLLFLQFSEDVSNVSNATIELRNSAGVVPVTVLYNDASRLAIILPAEPLAPSKYRLAASDLIVDAAGNAFDGDSAGGAGGIFNFRFDVLPADVNGDRRANTNDLSFFSPAFNAQLGQANYNPRVDWNADGRINSGDLAFFSTLFNVRIDNLAEPGAPFGGGGGGGGGAMRMSGGVPSLLDDFFKGLGDEDEKKRRGPKDGRG